MQAVDITGLRKVYANGTVALRDIDLSVGQGDFFGFLGENGAGKSTTIGIITSLLKKTAGRVNIFGYDLDKDLQQVKRCIGLVPQEMNFNIFERVNSVLLYQAGYYGIPPSVAKERIDYYLKRLDLWNRRNTLCMHLSGGMKRRLMIVRALIHLNYFGQYPSLLILDEPTAGVDVELRYTIWEFLRELKQKGTTIILTTHYLEEAEQLCENIAIINKGSIIAKTDTQSLVNQAVTQTFICDLAAVASLPEDTSFTIRLVQPQQIEVDLKRHQTVNHLFQYLQQHGLEVVSLRNKSNRLESIFLDLINTHHSEGA